MDNYYEYFVNKRNHPDKKVILQQEKNNQFQEFNRYDAFQLAKCIIEVAYKNKCSIGIRIVMNNEVIFQYIMDGLNIDNSLNWLLRKEKVCQLTHHSSYYTFLDNITSHQYDQYTTHPDYAICGGSFPLIVDDHYIGCITVTGGRPHEDHQMIIDAMMKIKDLYK